MKPISQNDLINSGTAKRADSLKMRIEDLHEEPGFNLRDEGEDLQASIEAIVSHLANGGRLPPLEVRPRPEGGAWIVDGHRRSRAYRLADERGLPVRDPKSGELFVKVELFQGNDADRTLRVITSAEGRALAPLEVAKGYARLRGFGWKADDIAAKVCKTRQHVSQMLILADANSDVHALVRSGAVSASLAVKVVHTHGEDAGAILAKKYGEAKDAGKAKLTAGGMAPKALPRAVVDSLVGSVDLLLVNLPKETREHLTVLQKRHEQIPEEETVTIPAWLLVDLMGEHEGVAEARAKQEQRAREAANKAAQTDIEDAA